MRIRPRSALALAVVLSLLLACAMSVSALRDQGDSPSKMVRLRQFPKAALKRTAEATAQPSPSPSPSQPRFSEVHQQQQNQQRQRIAAQIKAKQQASVRNDAFFGAEDDYPTYVLTDNPNANIFRSLTPWGQVNPNNVLQTLTPPIRKMNKDWHLSVQEMGINTRGVREIDSKESLAPHGMSPVMPSWDYPLAPRAADFPLRSFEASKSDPFPIMEFLEVESKAGSRASSHTSAEASASASSRATARVRGQERLAQRANVAAAEALKALQHHTAQLGGYPGEKPFKGGVGGSLQNAFYGGGGQAPSWVLPQTPVGSPFPSRLKTGYHIDPSEVHLYPLTPPLGIEYADKRSPKDRYMPMFARYTSDYGLGAFSFIQQAEEIARHQNEAAQRYYDHVLAEHEKRRAAQPNA